MIIYRKYTDYDENTKESHKNGGIETDLGFHSRQMFFKKILHISKNCITLQSFPMRTHLFAVVRKGLRGKPEGMLSGCGAVG